MNLQELEKKLEYARKVLAEAPAITSSESLFTELRDMAQAFILMHGYYEQWRNSTVACDRSGKTGPYTYQEGQEEGSRKCFACGCLHPEDARATVFNAYTIIEELIDHRDEAKKLATMLYEGAETPETKWVKVLADATINHLAATEVK